MSEGIRRVIERFPHFEAIIRELSETHMGFGVLCHEYERINLEIGNLDQQVDLHAYDEARNLHRRRLALEEELVGLMETNLRTSL